MQQSKKRKTVAVSIVLIVLLILGGLTTYYIIISDAKYDYKRYPEIPKGYVEYDGKVNAGKDYDHLYWYRYDEKPNLCNDYQIVKGDDKMVKKAFNIYSCDTDYELENMVTDDDYFIIKSYNRDGEEIEWDDGAFNEENYRLFFYDTKTNTLYDCRLIW